MVQLVGALSLTKRLQYDSQSEYMPRLWVQSLVGANMGGSPLVFCTSMFLSPSPFPYL